MSAQENQISLGEEKSLNLLEADLSLLNPLGNTLIVGRSSREKIMFVEEYLSSIKDKYEEVHVISRSDEIIQLCQKSFLGVFAYPEASTEFFKTILDNQETKTAEKTSIKPILILLEEIPEQRVLTNDPFRKLYNMGRIFNISTCIIVADYSQIPLISRHNAHTHFFVDIDERCASKIKHDYFKYECNFDQIMSSFVGNGSVIMITKDVNYGSSLKKKNDESRKKESEARIEHNHNLENQIMSFAQTEEDKHKLSGLLFEFVSDFIQTERERMKEKEMSNIDSRILSSLMHYRLKSCNTNSKNESSSSFEPQ